MENVSGVEIGLKEKFIKEAESRGDKTLIISDHGDLVFDMDGFDYTKVTDARLIIGGKIIPLEKINTWASLLRSVNKATKKQRDKEDIAGKAFDATMTEMIRTFGLVTNSNFSHRLFDDDSFINSSVYRNNQNHALEVWRGKKICAVYAGEVVIVLNALIASSGSTDNDDEVCLLISYRKREPIPEQINKLANTFNLNLNTVIKQLDNNERKKIFEEIKNKLEGFYQDDLGEKFQIEVEIDEKSFEKNNIQKAHEIIGNIQSELIILERTLKRISIEKKGDE